ncbi:MAG TPA: iron ABC transporter permease [Candidatus Binatia bacterium]|nr:iron ABC transporter permease [Candidatus Binatia bacterium]
MSVTESAQILRSRPSAVDWSQAAILGVAALASLAIIGLLVTIVWMSFRTGVPGQPSPYTLSNYTSLLADPYNYRVMVTTLIFSGVTIGVAIPLGFVFAWFIERTDIRYKAFAMSLLSIGILFPTFLKAMGWVFLCHPRIGVINIFLMQWFDLKSAPLNVASLGGIGFVQGLTLTPLAYVMISAALRSMNPALVEASNVHGVSKFKTLLGVELPLIWPALFSAVIWMFTVAIAAFDVPGVIGMANNIFTFSTAVYFMINPNEGLPRYGLSGAYGTLMVIFSLVLMIPYFVALKQSHRYQIISGKSYQSRPVELGRWWMLGWGLLGLYFTLAFVLPLLAIFWVSLLPYVQVPSRQALASISFERYGALALDSGLLQAGLNTLLLMVLVPTLIVIICAAISWIVTRSRLRWRVALDAIAFLPHPVPNLLFALAIAYFALLISNVVPVYGTIYVIMAVYVVCWVSFGTRVLNNSMIQLHRELEEAAQIGGVSTLRILAKVIVPLIRPGLAYAWIWTSLSAYRELTMAVFLASPKSQVLSTYIWGQWHGGGLGDAAAIAIIMMAVMAPLVTAFWIYARRLQHVESAA